MIDIDRMHEQLESALTGGAPPSSAAAAPAAPSPTPRRRRPAPAPPPAPRPTRQPRTPGPLTAPELLEQGRLADADAFMATGSHPRDALTWSTMRALLDGRQDAARAGVEELRRLADRTDDPQARDHAWTQRFWVAIEWGSQEERYEVLDHCRTRAYRFDELQWWGNLALLLAVMGNVDEATRAVDEAATMLPRVPADGRWLDTLTNLVEAAALLGDAGRVVALSYSVRWPQDRLVVVGAGVVCKGSVDRYRALTLAAAGKWAEAGACFHRAESVHRALGARPLLARTLQQASGSSVAA